MFELLRPGMVFPSSHSVNFIFSAVLRLMTTCGLLCIPALNREIKAVFLLFNPEFSVLKISGFLDV